MGRREEGSKDLRERRKGGLREGRMDGRKKDGN